MSETQVPARDGTWDVARGIGMALVIYGHFLEPTYPARAELGKAFNQGAFQQWQVIYSFHMMLFFLVSGAVNRNLAKKSFPDVLRGSLRLLALAWVVHLTGIATAMALGTAPNPVTSFREAVVAVFDPIVEGYCWSVGVLWFLTSLCFVQLLAYLTLRRLPALAVILGASLATAVVVYFDAPNQYLFRTWFPGLCFFALGYQLSHWQVRWPPWLCVPLFAATLFLAPLNDGCACTLQDACARFGDGPFGVRMFGGSYGFLPLFFLSSLCGSFAIVCLSTGLARSRASGPIAYMGRKSLELFFINGFVATFLPPFFSGIAWPHLNALDYFALAVGIVGLHLVALRILGPVLGWINSAGISISDGLTRFVTGSRQKPSGRPA